MRNTSKVFIGGIIVLVLLFTTTRPDQLPAWALPVPYLLLFMCLVLAFGLLPRRLERSVGGRDLYFKGLIASFPVAVLALQSLGQLSLRDLVMLLAVYTVAGLYLRRFNLDART